MTTKKKPEPADERAGQEALQRLADLTRRVMAVPKNEITTDHATDHVESPPSPVP
jgi:hypothetical protein